ncbi:MAG: NAD-dependent epimerase/dehydratase family protein [Pirellulaceae bacterium]
MITGSSGYVGGKLVEYYRSRQGDLRILGIDIEPPPSEESTPHEFRQLDVQSEQLSDVLEQFAPDTIVHSAFVVPPMHDERRMREINVEGFRNLLQAVDRCQPERFLFVSSTTAYGALADNPIPLDESMPVRASAFRYAMDKVEDERLLGEFAQQHGEMAVSWVRPAIVGGPKMDNYLYRFIFGLPVLVLSDGYDTPLQFVHEDDVSAGIDAVLQANGRGAYNLAPDSASPLSEIAEATGRRCFSLPFWFVKFLHGLAWKVRLPIHESPGDFLYYARYPWVVAPRRLEQELDFRFQYSSNETVEAVVEYRTASKEQP